MTTLSVFRTGSRDDRPEVVSDRILTVPNLLSLVRLGLLPLVYLDIVGGRFGRALLVLIAITWSDAVDGYVARRFHQVSRLGQLFDPVSDRILVIVVGAALIVADLVPWWAVAAVLGRDVFLLVGGVVLAARGVRPPSVTDLGKAATFGLMSSLPTFLLAAHYGSAQLRGAAWTLLASFGVLYYLAAGQYVAIALRRSEVTT